MFATEARSDRLSAYSANGMHQELRVPGWTPCRAWTVYRATQRKHRAATAAYRAEMAERCVSLDTLEVLLSTSLAFQKARAALRNEAALRCRV